MTQEKILDLEHRVKSWDEWKAWANLEERSPRVQDLWDSPNQLMIIPTTQAAIASVDAQPSHCSQPVIVNLPMTRR